jgi:Flp pilus assembly pilin Flp
MRFPANEEGQGLAEYAWTLVLVGILLVAVVLLLGLAVFDLWDKAWDWLKQAFTPDAAWRQSMNYLALRLGGFFWT